MAHLVQKGLLRHNKGAFLRVGTETVWALISEGEEGYADLPSVTIQPQIGRHVIHRVNLDDFKRSRERYVKSSDIANYLEVPRTFVERVLRRYRVPSACRPKSLAWTFIGWRIFRRSFVPSE